MTHANPKLLVLDDDGEIASVIAEIAARAGFDAEFSTDTTGFRTALERQPPDVVMLDLQMPECDGIEVLRSLAAESCEAQIGLVSGTDERTLLAAKEFGESMGLRMLGVLQKPFLPDELLDCLAPVNVAGKRLSVGDLAEAIRADQLVVHYQPTLCRFADGTWDVDAVEALLRWDHPARGVLAPDSFMQLGEDGDLMRRMTDFVLQRGVEQLRAWSAQGLNLGLRVNIAASLLDDVDFPDRIEVLLNEHSVDPSRLTLEVNEAATLEPKVETVDILTRIRVKQINLALDDFGIGYSSLTQLFRLPFSELKIDRTLGMEVHLTREARLVVETLVGLAHKLKMKACAEGIESDDALELLNDMECDNAQGYLINRPVPAGEIPAVVERWARESRHAGMDAPTLAAGGG